MKRLAAEFLGTFILVFIGTGAVVVNDVAGGRITHVGVALSFGLVVLAMIYAIGDVSGCHINPAVTVGFFAGGRMDARWVGPYVGSQCLGAICGSLVLRLMFPGHPTLGATVPFETDIQSFVMETILTFILTFVILGVSTGSKEKGVLAGIAIGAVIAMEALVGGPISGASMNPARSLGPAVVSLKFESLWIYWTAPFLGALAAVATSRFVFAEKERAA